MADGPRLLVAAALAKIIEPVLWQSFGDGTVRIAGTDRSVSFADLARRPGVDPAKLIPVLHFDGTPITARFIADEIVQKQTAAKRAPVTEAAE